MSTLFFTLTTRWSESYLSGMLMLHALLGHDLWATPTLEPSPALFVQILQEIAENRYDPSKYFRHGVAQTVRPASKVPTLDVEGSYVLVGLNVLTSRGQFVSVPAGGVVFEHPVLAILAAHAVSTRQKVAVPLASDNDELWKKAAYVGAEIQQQRYNANQLFGKYEESIPSGVPLKFEFLVVSAEQILALRARGVQVLKVSVPPRFYELFATK